MPKRCQEIRQIKIGGAIQPFFTVFWRENHKKYEIKQGPYAPLAPENLAPWSPEAEDTEGVKKYLEWLESQI